MEKTNKTLPYPRICAHRGLSALYPENSLAAFEAAIAAGAHEIEFDLRPANDGRIMVRHDPLPDPIPEDIPTLEDVLAQCGRRVVMNIHIKPPEGGGPYDRAVFKRILAAIDRYGCREYVYFAGDAAVLETALELAPDIERACIEGSRNFTILEHALRRKCRKVQLCFPYFTQEMVDEAHAHGMRCGVFFTDDPGGAREFFKMGIDTVLTNDCANVNSACFMTE